MTPPVPPEPGADPVVLTAGDGDQPQRPKLLPRRPRRIRGARTPLPPRGPHHQRHRATAPPAPR